MLRRSETIRPLYISGEKNRPLIGQLKEYVGEDFTDIVSETRHRASVLQESVEAYAE